MYAHWCLHNLKILPSEFVMLDSNEKAFIIASIDYYLEKKEKMR